MTHMWRYLRWDFTPGHCMEQVWVTASALWSQSVIAQKETFWGTTSILQTTSSPPHFVLAARSFYQKPAAKQRGMLVSEWTEKKKNIQNVSFLFLFVRKSGVGLIKKWRQQLAAKWHWSGKKSSFCTLLCFFFHRRTDSCLNITYLNRLFTINKQPCPSSCFLLTLIIRFRISVCFLYY